MEEASRWKVPPSRENPEYSVCVVLETGDVLEITPVVLSLDISHREEQLAVCVTLRLANTQYEGKWVTSILKVRQRVFLYANDGERHEEVFRGWLWSTSYASSPRDRELTVKCYYDLIYWQESEVSEYFAKGKSTQAVVTSLFRTWGVPMRWGYVSTTHDKLALRGTLADIVTSDVLDEAKKQTGKKYAIVMEQDTAVIRTAGDNEAYYRFEEAGSALETKWEVTMDGMVTQVLILGQAKDDKRTPVVATITGDTATYGTLQKLQDRGDEKKTTLAKAKEEARHTIDEKGKPKVEYTLKSVDVPWIRKGDRVYVHVGGIWDKRLIVWSLDRTISDRERTMTLTMREVDAP